MRDLADSLREMAVAASECPNLLVIDSTVGVIKEIGHISLEITLLIYQYITPPVTGKNSIFGILCPLAKLLTVLMHTFVNSSYLYTLFT